MAFMYVSRQQRVPIKLVIHYIHGLYISLKIELTKTVYMQKVIIHSPHKKIGSSNNRISWSETNYDIALLNFNQEITAIETGCLKENDSKEILVIGSPTHVLGNFVFQIYVNVAALIDGYKTYNLQPPAHLFSLQC